MRNCPNIKAERWRSFDHPASAACAGTNAGSFRILASNKAMLFVIASDGGGWDHVSVHVSGRCPTWEEMCVVKELFFKDDEVVMQLHPAKKDYVNCHPFTLHLWRPQTPEETAKITAEFGDDFLGELQQPEPIPLPPTIMV